MEHRTIIMSKIDSRKNITRYVIPQSTYLSSARSYIDHYCIDRIYVVDGEIVGFQYWVFDNMADAYRIYKEF